MGKTLLELEKFGVIPVVTIEDAADAPKLGKALTAGGLPCAEITFRTAAAAEAIKRITTENPEMLVGAGTVFSVEQAEIAVANGAKFIVTPGFDTTVVKWCITNDIPITPGVMTPTEIKTGMDKGLKVMKFFPAEAAGGLKTLKAICAPYQGIRFIPTGGINSDNLKDYLAFPAVMACGGSWFVTQQLIAAGNFQEIKRLTEGVVAIVKEIRG